MSSEGWLRTDEHYDVLSSTDILAFVAPTLAKNQFRWKWAILAAQNAVQGALVCAIQDSSKTNILSKRSAREALSWLGAPTNEWPEPHLADFKSLLTKFQDRYPNSIDDERVSSLEKLHNIFRNRFAHFVPRGWSIEIDMLPPLIIAAVDFVEIAMRQDQVTIQRRKSNTLARRRAWTGCGAVGKITCPTHTAETFCSKVATQATIRSRSWRRWDQPTKMSLID